MFKSVNAYFLHFLKVAEQVGIDKGGIPDLAKAPSSLLEALEQHYNSMDEKGTKKGGRTTPAPTTGETPFNDLRLTHIY